MTKKLFHDDSYQTKFKAKVLKYYSDNGRYILILDQTCFYPEVGGQICDKGFINRIPVIDVQEVNGNVIHYLQDDIKCNCGESVNGEIDWKERFDHMQQHSGQHILSATLIELWQKETQTFHMGKDVCTLDILFTDLDDQKIGEIEERLNQIIYENRPINHYYLDDKSKIAEKNIRKAQKNHEKVRIIEIKNFDLNACGGTHCSNTGEVGIIKIIGYVKYKEKIRISFICGHRALSDYQKKHKITKNLSGVLTTSIDHLGERVIQLNKNQIDLKKQVRRMEKKILQFEVEDLKKNNCREQNGLFIITKLFLEKSPQSLKQIACILTSQERYIAILGAEKPEPVICISSSKDLLFQARKIIEQVASNYKGKGGGSDFLVMASLERGNDVWPAMSKANDLFIEKID